MVGYRVVSFIIGYCFGVILPGYILGKLSHVDLRTQGSGNIGTTNATRVLGVKKGLITLLFDVAKGLMAAGVVWLIFHTHADIAPEDLKLLLVYAAFGAVIGHDFPFYMGFKGGKGVATSLAFLAIVDVRAMLLAMVCFVGAILLTRYVSLGSILGAVAVLIYMFLGGGLRAYAREGLRIEYEVGAMVAVASAILLIRHKDNIKRLLAGEENKVGKRG